MGTVLVSALLYGLFKVLNPIHTLNKSDMPATLGCKMRPVNCFYKSRKQITKSALVSVFVLVVAHKPIINNHYISRSPFPSFKWKIFGLQGVDKKHKKQLLFFENVKKKNQYFNKLLNQKKPLETKKGFSTNNQYF